MKSSNSKTGPIPVSITSSETCPDCCPFKDNNSCYAKLGPLSIHWNRVNKGTTGLKFLDFLKVIGDLPEKTLWRHNVAGDLPGKNSKIDINKLNQLVTVNKGKRGFTYTHKPVMPTSNVELTTIHRNKMCIAESNKNGFTINLSANSIKEADELVKLNIAPVVTIVKHDQIEDFRTADNNLVKICPAAIKDNVTCKTCGLCQKHKRKFIIGFPAHGTKYKVIDQMLNE